MGSNQAYLLKSFLLYCLIYILCYSWCAKTTRARKTNAQERTWAEGRWLCAEEKKKQIRAFMQLEMIWIRSAHFVCTILIYLIFLCHTLQLAGTINCYTTHAFSGKQTYEIQSDQLFLSFKSEKLANQVCWLKYGRWLEKAGLNWLEAFSVVVVLHASWLVLPQGNSFW